MEHLRQAAGRLVSASISDNTKAAYGTALSALSKFRTDHGLTMEWPVPVDVIYLFIADCFERGCAASTIQSYVAGISFYHKLNGYVDMSNVFVIRKLLEGCRRQRRTRDVRAPILQSTLVRILDLLPSVCSSAYETCLFQTAYSIAYFGLFRVSELTYAAKSPKPIGRSGVSIGADGGVAILTLDSSKTSSVPVTVRIPKVGGTVCPVRLLQQYISLRPASEAQLFIHRNGTPLTRYQFSAVLGKVIRALGLPFHKYKSHSFRIGRATQLSLQGVSDNAIQRMGRWKSDAFKTYIRQ